MQSITIKGRVGGDGILRLEVPVAVREVDVEVVVVVQPAAQGDNGTASENLPLATHSGWPPGFLENTYGCLRDDPPERAPQGEYETREELA